MLLWNDFRKCENEWHKSGDGNKPMLKAKLRQAQKKFDREVQKADIHQSPRCHDSCNSPLLPHKEIRAFRLYLQKKKLESALLC